MKIDLEKCRSCSYWNGLSCNLTACGYFPKFENIGEGRAKRELGYSATSKEIEEYRTELEVKQRDKLINEIGLPDNLIPMLPNEVQKQIIFRFLKGLKDNKTKFTVEETENEVIKEVFSETRYYLGFLTEEEINELIELGLGNREGNKE